MMQVHSHLIKNEVIGFLAGHEITRKHKDSKVEQKTLYISEAYPAESLDQDAGNNLNQERNVEIAPESAS